MLSNKVLGDDGFEKFSSFSKNNREDIFVTPYFSDPPLSKTLFALTPSDPSVLSLDPLGFKFWKVKLELKLGGESFFISLTFCSLFLSGDWTLGEISAGKIFSSLKAGV